MLFMLVAVIVGAGLYLYPAWRAAKALQDKIGLCYGSFALEVQLDREKLPEEQEKLFAMLARLTGIQEEAMYRLSMRGNVQEDKIHLMIYPYDATEPLAEFYLSEDINVINETMLYNAIRGKLTERVGLLDYLMPRQEETLYMTLEQVEQLFGLDLSAFKGFDLSVLAVIRVVYFIVGPDRLWGTWVQNGWILLALMTVFMGSMLAYKEPVLKKRLAYSTVSQVSYVMFGLSLLTPLGFVGALSHVVFHSVIKHTLFLAAGVIIVTTGWTRVEQMRGLGRVMPLTLGCYTIASLALIGIPPASGFVSKWYLASGALSSGTGIWSWVGPVVLLVSALLTAGYLLPLTIQGYFPGHDFKGEEIEKRKLAGKEPSLWMLGPVGILAAAALLFGCFPDSIVAMAQSIAAMVL